MHELVWGRQQHLALLLKSGAFSAGEKGVQELAGAAGDVGKDYPRDGVLEVRQPWGEATLAWGVSDKKRSVGSWKAWGIGRIEQIARCAWHVRITHN